MHPSALWDQRYSNAEFVFGTQPNQYLKSHAHRLHPGMNALCVADGEGRNGVWLAEQGLNVLSVDLSSVGLAKAANLAAQRGVTLQTQQCDLRTWDWPLESFDLVASIFLHIPSADRTPLNHHIVQALRPGGLLILETYRPQQLLRSSGGPKDPDLLPTLADLQSDFADLTQLEILEGTALIEEGPLHSGLSEVLRLVARKL